VGTGLITIIVGDMTSNDTYAKPTRLNNLMPSILIDIHRRIQWDAIDEERKQLAAERRARRYAKATELARAHYQEKERYKILLKRATEWKERLVVMEYLQTLEGVPEAAEWLRWCRNRLAGSVLLGDIDLPTDTPFNENENRQLISAFEEKFPYDESLW